jgi:glyoxylase-like metal-dependent hydrolase (beta-lactamase superfamily II)
MNSATLFPPDSKPVTRSLTDDALRVTSDVVGLRSVMVNVYFISRPDGGWVLVDAGLPISGPAIRATATKLFGDRRPDAILLTHGHFDHVGVLETLAAEWDVPVYAHPLEMPYLTGRSSYPPPDPWVGGGMSLTSPLYPRSPINLGRRAQHLPEDGSVPFLEEWRWVHTPGHSPGHVSFFRERDRVLIAGDAFVTTKQESLISVLAQTQHVFGPPQYFTHNFDAAESSVKQLAALDPEIAATGHGTPMTGERLRNQLNELAADFRHLAVPTTGRYVDSPVVADEDGPRVVPAAKPIPPAVYVAAAGAAALLMAAIIAATAKTNDQDHRRL